jgi:hypothetical protein
MSIDRKLYGPGDLRRAAATPRGYAHGMAWSWRLEKADGRTVGMSEETFPTQADAETWLGENWRGLREDAIDQVTLLDEENVVYEMSLDAA